jgi:ankyrin repeat domain-containing protein 50
MQKRPRHFYIQTRQKASEPTISECKDLLLEFINLYPKTTLILDALDECEKHKRGVLIEIFDYFVAHASRPVKIFISSRPDSDIREIFKTRANIEIQATDNHDDITRFVKSEITRHPRWNKMSSGLQTDIIETLQERSQGM